MPKKLVTIVHVDLTDVPPARSIRSQFLVDVTDSDLFASQLKTLKLAVRKHSDGNDEQYQVKATDPDEVTKVTQDEWLGWTKEFIETLI